MKELMKKLEQYKMLMSEKKDIERRVREKRKVGNRTTNDELAEETEKTRKLLEGKLIEKEKIEREIEEGIERIDDPLIRSIIRARYIDGLSWRMMEMRIPYSYNNIRIKWNKFKEAVESGEIKWYNDIVTILLVVSTFNLLGKSVAEKSAALFCNKMKRFYWQSFQNDVLYKSSEEQK